MAESTQHKLGRNRPPRVQITYDVHTNGAIEMRKLPLVVGILSDLAGNPAQPLPKLKERKFVKIDRDTFGSVMAGIAPRLVLQVDNKLTEEEGKLLGAELNFRSLEDFEPISIVRQVDELRALYEARQRLTDLLAKLDGNDALDELLQAASENEDWLNQLKPTTREEGNGENN